MKDVQSIILKQNADARKNRRIALIRKKKTARMSAYKVTTGILASLTLAAISFIGFIVMCIYSAVLKGNAGMWVGVLGIIFLIANIIGLFFGILEKKNDEAKQKYVMLGIVANAVLVVLYIILYI